MVKVNICNVVVLDNPSSFRNPFQFEITFDCLEPLADDLEWKIIYVGSAENVAFDQVLDTVYVGPTPAGKHKFVFQSPPPNPAKIPDQDAIGVTVVLLTCSYRDQEFIRVGYYVNNEYTDPELRENPPAVPDFDKVQRNILATSPRVTRFKIDWGDCIEPPSHCNAENVPPAHQHIASDKEPSLPPPANLGCDGSRSASVLGDSNSLSMDILECD